MEPREAPSSGQPDSSWANEPFVCSANVGAPETAVSVEQEEATPRSTRSSTKTNLAHVFNVHIEERLLVFYEVPKVRQTHEDPQTEHQVDWADVFFDLT